MSLKHNVTAPFSKLVGYSKLTNLWVLTIALRLSKLEEGSFVFHHGISMKIDLEYIGVNINAYKLQNEHLDMTLKA